jgi:hypothetical protein
MENSKLQPGNYMKVTPVLLFLAKHPIQCMHANKLTKHMGEYNVYFNTEDLKPLMPTYLFNELECETVTHMILS